MKPLNRENLLSFYMPANSLISYTALSINIMNPDLRTKFFGNSDLTNFLLWNTVVGSGCYLYSRQHLDKVPQHKRVAYAAVGGTLFSFGSVLMWAFLKNLLPQNNNITTLVGLASGFALVRVASDYLSEVDA